MLDHIGDTALVKTIDASHHLKINHEISKPGELPASHLTLNDLKESLEMNEARVLYFRAEIALGHYKIDHNKIAMKMLNMESV